MKGLFSLFRNFSLEAVIHPRCMVLADIAVYIPANHWGSDVDLNKLCLPFDLDRCYRNAP